MTGVGVPSPLSNPLAWPLLPSMLPGTLQVPSSFPQQSFPEQAQGLQFAGHPHCTQLHPHLSEHKSWGVLDWAVQVVKWGSSLPKRCPWCRGAYLSLYAAAAAAGWAYLYAA